MNRRSALARVAAAVVGVVAVVAVPAGPALAYPDYEAETTLTIDAAYGSPYADPAASGGQALAIWNNATATGTLTAPQAFTSLQIRAMGGICGSTDASPRMRVTVDGTALPERTIGASWESYPFTGSWAAGAHTIGVAFLNEYGDGTCNRFLEVDTIRVGTMPILKLGHTGTVTAPAVIVADSAAVGDRSVRITGSGRVTLAYPTTEGFDNVVVSARGDQCDGAPQLRMTVDGVEVRIQSFGTTPAGGRPWREASANTPADFANGTARRWSAGDHTLTLSLANPHSTTACTRALYIDRTMVSRSDGFVDAPVSGFITRSGTRLMLDGKPFKYAGLNAFGMSGCDQADGRPWSTAALDSFFSRLAPNTVTRTWAFANTGTAPLDNIVASAAKYRQKVVFTLSDGRNYCGEVDGSTGGPWDEGVDKTLAWYQSGFRTTFLPWVREVVGRYQQNTAVGFWEIINEPGSQENTAYTDALVKGFLDETAAVIKGIDPNHLISSGTVSQDYRGSTDFSYLHSGPNIDIGSLHEYEYDWFNPATNAYENSIVYNNLATLLTEMRQVDKPLIIGETGVYAADAPGCRTSVAARAGIVRQKLDGYLNQAGVAGVNLWGIVDGNPIRPGEPCPFEGAMTDPMIAQVQAKQAQLNG